MGWNTYIETKGLSKQDIESILISVLSNLRDSNNEVVDQLKLLNERIEEAFETRIKRNDI